MGVTGPCGRMGRRGFLAAGAILPALAAWDGSARAAFRSRAADDAAFGVPGPYPGRVIEARNPAMIRQGKKNHEAIKSTLAAGMKALTGAEDAVQAWRSFFEPGDVVGIKVVPNGYPLAHSSYELVLEVIEGLKAAGVKPKDMVVFDRYKSEFMAAKYQEILPSGIAWGAETPGDDEGQLRQSWPASEPLAGYDPDQFVEMNLVHAGFDPKDERTRRSHLGLIVTRRVNKLVLLPVLKDHGSAGVTGALKNMSHGLSNNVARSHSTPDTNACNMFIPEVVSHPIIRKKCVLHIMDGIRGVFQGGPFANNPAWAWEYNALLLATDPVAMDHIEWTIIDAQRKAKGLPPVAAVGKMGLDSNREGFDMRQPQHIALAANLGLGIFDFKSPRGRRHSIDHRVVNVA
jgi:hypothetical protein